MKPTTKPEIFIDLNAAPVRPVLDLLLTDRSTGKHIIWATDSYAHLGIGYNPLDEIMPDLVTGINNNLIQPRVCKTQAEQASRTRKHAEVFTPMWICKKMCDEFDTQLGSVPPEEYIRCRVLEITCGEAPFLTTRYDNTTGEPVPIEERCGLFDRKLLSVNALAHDESEWLNLAKTALQSTYGYEFQGDNLLIARVNVLCSFCKALMYRWKRDATCSEIKQAADIISWNLWQMDGLRGTRPFEDVVDIHEQMSPFDGNQSAAPPVQIYDYRENKCVEWTALLSS